MEKSNLEIAKELGINNPESLTPAQLKKAIAVENEKIQTFNLLKEKAKELGVVFSEDITFEALTADVETAEQAIEEKRVADLFKSKALILIDAVVGQVNFDNLSEEELSEALKEMGLYNRKAEVFIEGTVGSEKFKSLPVEELFELLQKKSAVVAVEGLEVVSGKTEDTILLNGIDYQFSEKAPESFKFMGIVKTQKEWIKDSEAMELMISGNLSYVKPLKK